MKTLLFFFVLLFASPAWAATTRYVATTGSNSNTCADSTSIATPKLTFTGASGALACMSGGDTLKVVAGSYNDRLLGSLIPIGSSGAPTIIEGNTATFGSWTLAPDESTCTTNGGSAISSSTRSWITIRHVVIDATNCTLFAIRLSSSAQNFVFEDFEGYGDSGNSGVVYLQSATTSNNTFRNCKVHDAGATSQDHVVYFSGPSNILERCTVYNALSGHGVHVYSGTSGVPNGNKIRFNFIHTAASWGIGIYSCTSGCEVYGNVIKDTGQSVAGTGGITLGVTGGTNNATIANNTFFSVDGSGAAIKLAGGSGHTVINNLLLSNANNTISNTSSGSAVTNNVTSTTDSILQDVATNKFSPSATGAATLVNQGTPTGKPVAFSAVGSAPDIGAFEAPIRVAGLGGAVVEDTSDTTYSISFSVTTQGTRNNVGLIGCTTANWAIVVAGSGATENACNFTQTNRVDITLNAAVTVGQSLTDAYTLGTLTDNANIGGDFSALHAYVLSYTAQSGTNNVDGAGAPDWAVIHFRQRSWYGALTGDDWIRAEDVDGIVVPGGSLCVDMGIAGTEADPDSTSFEWWGDCVPSSSQWCTDSGGNGTDFAITDSLATNGFAFTNAMPNIGDLQSITSATLTNPHAPTFVAGAVVAQQASQPTVDLSQDSMTQVRLCFKTSSSATAGTQFRIFARRAGAGANITMTVTPSFSIIPMQASGGF